MTPQAVLLGLEGEDPETVECVSPIARSRSCLTRSSGFRRTSTVNSRYDAMVDTQLLNLGGRHAIRYVMDRDMLWRMEALPTHPNGMRFSAFSESGDLLATNTYYSVGGGFVVNERTQGSSLFLALGSAMNVSGADHSPCRSG